MAGAATEIEESGESLTEFTTSSDGSTNITGTQGSGATMQPKTIWEEYLAFWIFLGLIVLVALVIFICKCACYKSDKA